MQPVEGAMDGRESGETSDALVGFGVSGVVHLDHLLGLVYHDSRSGECGGYSTDTRKRPLAGAVGPAAERLRAARMPGVASTSRRLAPMSTKVPTRLRTMWCRKPLPVT